MPLCEKGFLPLANKDMSNLSSIRTNVKYKCLQRKGPPGAVGERRALRLTPDIRASSSLSRNSLMLDVTNAATFSQETDLDLAASRHN